MQSAYGIIFNAGEQRPPTGGVRQDKVASKSYRAQQPQPDARPEEYLSRQIAKKSTASHQPKKHSTKRQTEATTVWLRLPLKAEAQRVAGQLGLSVSALGAKFFEAGLRQTIAAQQATLLEPMLAKTMRSEMRRKTELDRLCHKDISQLLRLVYNILVRMPDNPQMSEASLNQIRDESANAAYKDLQHRLTHTRILFEDALQNGQEEKGDI